MKAVFLAIPVMAVAGCASVQTASVADYNGDGLISNAEYVQYQKQKDIEDRNVYTESVKRRNIPNAARDVSDTLWHARRAQNAWKSF